MKPIRVVHFGDLHYSAEHREPALKSLDYLIDYCEREQPDLIVNAGDTFDHGIQNSERGGLPDLLDRFRRLIRIAPIISDRGTPTHDVFGCYAPLQALGGFTLIDPGDSYFLTDLGYVEMDPECVETEEGKGRAVMLILGLPEPSKEWFLADKKGLGREEANQAVIDGMREMLLGLGALRKQYASLPCLMVYHGQVAGSSLANGQTLRPGGIQIGRDDLALVGADYYALGDIHLAQQIGDLPAYYSGSCFPVNWGELDQKSFRVVNFYGDTTFPDDGSGSIEWEEVPFPHAPRKKIVTSWPEGEDRFEPDGQVDGFQVWLEVKGDKSIIGDLNAEATLERLLAAGALPGSRVTATVIPTETVRAGEITEANDLTTKLDIYSLNSGELLPPNSTITEKAQQLEADARRQGLTSDGLYIRIKSLRLRGAIGVKRGQDKDEIALDLGSYDAGLVALIGANGEGKTTLIENMHPYSQMLTRDGKLQDHFYLRDSYRDLKFVDERTGDEYRALLQIDGANKSGAVDYHLYRNGEPIVNGRKADYDEQIEKLFGSLSLYLRSAFVSQRPTKGNPDLSAATQGEKKALFRELAGLDYLQAYSETAREKAKAIETETERDKGKIEALTEDVEHAPDLEGRKAELEGAVNDLANVVQGLIGEGEELKAKAAEARKKADEQQAIIQKIRDKQLEQGELTKKAERIEHDEIPTLELVLVHEPAAIADLATAERLQAEEKELNADYQRYLEDRDKRRSEYNDKREAVRSCEQALKDEAADIDRAIAEVQTGKAQLTAAADALRKTLEKPIDEHCPTCGQLLPDEKREELIAEYDDAKAELETNEAELERINDRIIELGTERKAVEKKIAGLEWPLPTDDEPYDNSRLVTVQRELSEINVAEARQIVEGASNAKVRIEEARKRGSDLKEQIGALQTEISYLNVILNPDLLGAADLAETKLQRKREEYERKNSALIEMRADLKHVEEQIADLAEKRRQLEELRTALEAKLTDAREWRWLETACGPNGIQALELDALAPSIADVANRLLDAAYGARFSIEFRTTRMGGAGSKTHQIEDFRIVVHTDGEEQELDTLSGGESVWIKRAIYDAFSIVRDRNTGMRFLTAFQDEADGALDPEAKLAYFRMLEAAHAESGRTHTIVITHSPEIQEMIPQRIVMRELAETEPILASRGT